MRGVIVGEMVETNNDSSGAMNRRNLLKGAAAVGVGAAVWTVPSITSLGGTPAYASVCTSGAISYEIGSTNTSCNCNSDTAGQPKSAGYKPLNGRCGVGPTFPGTAVLSTSCGNPVGNSGECPPGFGGSAGICVTKDAAHQNLYCQTEVRVTDGNCGGIIGSPYYGAIIQPGNTSQFLPLPGVPCQGQGNIFYNVYVRCSIEEECL